MLTSARWPRVRDHWPAQHTTFSQAIRPRSVTTAATRPSSPRSIADTAVSSTIRTPPWRAPRASAWVMSLGLAWPSVGRNAAPTTSSTRISGHRSRASAGLNRCISSPNERAVVACRLTSIQRSALQARPEPAIALPAGGKPGLRFQAVVERHRVAEHLGDVGAGPQLANQPGGMEGGPGGELVPFQQHDLVDAPLGKVIGDGTADNAPADDDDPRRGRQVAHSPHTFMRCTPGTGRARL